MTTEQMVTVEMSSSIRVEGSSDMASSPLRAPAPARRRWPRAGVGREAGSYPHLGPRHDVLDDHRQKKTNRPPAGAGGGASDVVWRRRMPHGSRGPWRTASRSSAAST